MAVTQLVQEQWQIPFTCSSLTENISDDNALKNVDLFHLPTLMHNSFIH